MLRRQILSTTAIAPLVVAGGCSFIQNLPQYADDVQTIAGSLGKVSGDVAAIVGLPAATLTKVQGWISDIKMIAGQIGSAASAGASGLIANFATTFNNITTALGAKVPPIVGTVLQAGAALLPSILSAAGIALAGPSPAMSPARARAVLAAVANS